MDNTKSAGVSNGTLFHHFPTRQDLAAAVVAAGLADHHDALLHELGTADSPRHGVTRLVLRHLHWIEDNQQLARLLLSAPPEVLRADVDDRVLADNRGFFADVAAWLRGHGWPGHPELTVLVALWVGPAQEYARRWLADPHTRPSAAAGAALADGAWQALRPLLRQETR